MMKKNRGLYVCGTWAVAWVCLFVEGGLLLTSLEERDTTHAWGLIAFTVPCAAVVLFAFVLTGLWVARMRRMTRGTLLVLLSVTWLTAIVSWGTIVPATQTTSSSNVFTAAVALIFAQPIAAILTIAVCARIWWYRYPMHSV